MIDSKLVKTSLTGEKYLQDMSNDQILKALGYATIEWMIVEREDWTTSLMEEGVSVTLIATQHLTEAIRKKTFGVFQGLDAVIFDMDGVLSDTQKHHSRIESELLAEAHITISPLEITEKYAGVHTLAFFTELLGDREKAARLVTEKWIRINKVLSREGVDAIPGIYDVLEHLKEKNIILGVASASPLSFIKTVLELLGITDYFQVITSAEEVDKGKPAPDVFLKTAERLKVAPHKCLVIEDGISGMIGAKAAGMRVIAYVPEKEDYPADIIASRLSDLLLQA